MTNNRNDLNQAGEIAARFVSNVRQILEDDPVLSHMSLNANTMERGNHKPAPSSAFTKLDMANFYARALEALTPQHHDVAVVALAGALEDMPSGKIDSLVKIFCQSGGQSLAQVTRSVEARRTLSASLLKR